jgi:hypothetical protein
MSGALSLRAETDPQIAHLRSAEQRAWVDSDDARARLRQTEAAITTQTSDLALDLKDAWERAYPDTARAAETTLAGTGRFGRGRAEVSAARENLTSWARGWQPILTDLTGLPVDALLDPDQLSTRMPSNGSSALQAAIGRYAEHAAGQAHPELAATRHAVATCARAVLKRLPAGLCAGTGRSSGRGRPRTSSRTSSNSTQALPTMSKYWTPPRRKTQRTWVR